jgi:hypothetical protein
VDRADHTVSGKGGDDMGLNRMLAAAWIAQTTPLWTVLRLVSGKGGDDVVLNRCRWRRRIPRIAAHSSGGLPIERLLV